MSYSTSNNTKEYQHNPTSWKTHHTLRDRNEHWTKIGATILYIFILYQCTSVSKYPVIGLPPTTHFTDAKTDPHKDAII